MSIIVWFNGRSQEPLVRTLPTQSIEIGCNHIERVRPVNAVAAFDIDVVKRLPLNPDTQYFTRVDARIPQWQTVDNQIVSGANSGILALWVARNCFAVEPVYIIGCDWGISDDSVFDSIYGQGPRRKYTNHGRRKMSRLMHKRQAYIVHNQQPDVPLPVISEQQFLDKLQ